MVNHGGGSSFEIVSTYGEMDVFRQVADSVVGSIDSGWIAEIEGDRRSIVELKMMPITIFVFIDRYPQVCVNVCHAFYMVKFVYKIFSSKIIF